MINRIEYALNIAKADENIRCVILYGSRANDNIIPDRYQDYDIIFIAIDRNKFDFSVFEDVKIKINVNEIAPESFEEETTYLMLFGDDSRIDLTVCTMEVFISMEYLTSNHPLIGHMKCLLDKDKNLSKLITVNSGIWNIEKMDEATFNSTCAAFFWQIQDVVIGLKRDELPYALSLRDEQYSMRDMLNKMINEYIGLNNNYSVKTGCLPKVIFEKYRKMYLSDELYKIYKNTYLSNTEEDIWTSIGYMIDLFSLISVKIAETHGYHYPKADELYMRDYVMRVKKLSIIDIPTISNDKADT